MKRVRKIICEFVMICVFLSSTNTMLMATSVKTEEKTEPLSSVNDLLNNDKYLILESGIPYIDANASFLMNADTGQVIYTEDGEYALPILSVSKLLAAYVILDTIAESTSSTKFMETPNSDELPEDTSSTLENTEDSTKAIAETDNTTITWDTKIKAEGRPVLVSYEYNFSNLSLYEDELYTMRELFESLMIASSNASTMLIGQYLYGGESEFVAKIREKVAVLNLKQTTIFTSTGLNKADLLEYGYNELEEGNNTMSCADIAYMAQHLIQDHPEILTFSAMQTATFAQLTANPFEYTTTNQLLTGLPYAYEGVNGLKTGADLAEYTSNIVFTATQGDVNLIGVILGARTSDIRSEEAQKLLNYGFKEMKHITFIDDKTVLFGTGTVDMKYGSQSDLHVTVDKPLTLSTSFSDLKPTFTFIPTNDKYDPKYNAFKGPIKKGEVLGEIVVDYDDLLFLTDDTNKSYSINVIAAEDIDNGFFVFIFFEWLTDSIWELFK